MKRIYYYLDTHPVVIYYFGKNNYYFKLKHLARCLYLCMNKVCLKINKRYIITFKSLQQKYPLTKYTLHPKTLMINLLHLNILMSTFCTTLQSYVLNNFLTECFSQEGIFINSKFEIVTIPQHIDYNVECLEYVQGTILYKVQFIAFKNKMYFKAIDVVRYLQCSSFYSVNKFVDDENMVFWSDLKRYMFRNYVCNNFLNTHKENTIFLKQKGLFQLVMAVAGNDNIYREFVISVNNNNVTENYNKQPTLYKKKILKAEHCTVGKLQGLEFIVTSEQCVYYKLNQIVKLYNLKMRNYNEYQEYIIEWKRLKQTLGRNNINWKPNLIMIDGQGVYKMLQDVNLISAAEDFAYVKMYEAKTMWCKDFGDKK